MQSAPLYPLIHEMRDEVLVRLLRHRMCHNDHTSLSVAIFFLHPEAQFDEASLDGKNMYKVMI